MESFDAAGGFKGPISENCHLLELIQGKITDVAKVEWCKKMKLHMNFNHNYTSIELPGVVSLEWPARVQMKDKGLKKPYKKTCLKKELLNLARKDGKLFVNGVLPIKTGRSKGMITLVFYNDDASQAFVDSFAAQFAEFVYQYLSNVRQYSEKCVMTIMSAFADEDKLKAMDSKWDHENYRVKSLRATSTSNFIGEMGKLGLLDIPAALLADMKSRRPGGGANAPQFNSDAMDRVAAAMRFNDKEGCALTDVDGKASRYSDSTTVTNGQESNRSTTTNDVELNLTQLRTKFNRHKLILRDLSPEDPLFKETFFGNDPLHGMELEDSASAERKTLYSLTKKNIILLRARIAELEQGAPHLSGSAASPPVDGESEVVQGP